MRHISELTEHEAAELWNNAMPAKHTPFRGVYLKFPKLENPERIVLTQAIERLGIDLITGKIWADSDLHKIEIDDQAAQLYLLSIDINPTPLPF